MKNMHKRSVMALFIGISVAALAGCDNLPVKRVEGHVSIDVDYCLGPNCGDKGGTDGDDQDGQKLRGFAGAPHVLIGASGELKLLPGARFGLTFFNLGMPDASLFSLNVSGSSIEWPETGLVSLKLKTYANDFLMANKTFTYVKNNSTIVFANPAAVNQWLLNEGANPQQVYMDYQLSTFEAVPKPGINTVKVTALAGSASVYSTTRTFRVSSPCDHRGRSPRQCRMF